MLPETRRTLSPGGVVELKDLIANDARGGCDVLFAFPIRIRV
jgi:hypothetical protein